MPNVPSGIEKFPGRVLHAHDFRDAHEFAGKTLLLIGASYSAEDIALQCIKYGAKRVICTWRSKPMGFNWPESIEERPLVQKFEGNTAFFKDGSEGWCCFDVHWLPSFLSIPQRGVEIKNKKCFVPSKPVQRLGLDGRRQQQIFLLRSSGCPRS